MFKLLSVGTVSMGAFQDQKQDQELSSKSLFSSWSRFYRKQKNYRKSKAHLKSGPMEVLAAVKEDS
ncbi:hypothetical protein [Bacillus sp. RO1]|uniref:hypothetical protein n=1 Tax=Bacillus sp. RO1 TaxID=2722703 RepID=UPI0014570F77|nr:hypothetical protein [Bacillus sp. RO1]NLP49727.1 hypothetical protein [Bacillus sp. RO1]